MTDLSVGEVVPQDFSYERIIDGPLPLAVVGMVNGIEIEDVETGIYYALDELASSPTYRNWRSLPDILSVGTPLITTNATAEIRSHRKRGFEVDWRTELHTTSHGHVATSELTRVTYVSRQPRDEHEAIVHRKPYNLRPKVRQGPEFEEWSTKTPDKHLVSLLRRHFS